MLEPFMPFDTVTAERVFNAVLQDSHITDADLIFADVRTPNVAYTRHKICWILHFHYDYSMGDIGKFMERDRSTIYNSLMRINQLLLAKDEKSQRIAQHLRDFVEDLKDG